MACDSAAYSARTTGWCARSLLREVAPMRRPPSASRLMPPRPRRLMSTTRSGASTPSFMRSSRVVPPARKRTLAPCWAVGERDAAPIAAAASAGRRNSKVRMARLSASALPARVLDGRDDVGIGPATADVAAHVLADVVIGGTAGLVQQRQRRHDLPRGAEAALVRVLLEEGRL